MFAISFFTSLVPAALAASPATVTITNTLEPATVTIAPGTTVTWNNEDDERHRMRSVSGPAEFDSGDIEPGESFSMPFTAEGTYSYLDDRNDEDSSYFGTIIVSDDGVPEPPGGDTTVNIINSAFVPSSITVS
ncbi:MAG: hypothetical protein OEM39_09335, partial [Acidimicrobiia bacterium]|nr:hypothetical protein [Acidimicrobiia bacterium]